MTTPRHKRFDELRGEFEETILYRYHPANKGAWDMVRDDIMNWWLSKLDSEIQLERERLATRIKDEQNPFDEQTTTLAHSGFELAREKFLSLLKDLEK